MRRCSQGPLSLIHISGDRAGRIVGVQGGKDEVPGQCGLHGDGGGFGVADFADQDDVRVLAHDGAQPVGEGQPDFGIDLYLPHAFQFVFNRIFDGQDVLVRRGQFLNCLLYTSRCV